MNTTFNAIGSAANSQLIDVVEDIKQGDDIVSNRQGRQIFVKSLVIRGWLQNGGAGGDATVRLCIYACNTAYTSNLGMADILTPLRRNNMYKLYRDRHYRITTDDQDRTAILKIYVPINRRITYQSTGENENSVAIRIHLTSDNDIAEPVAYGFWKISYKG